MLGEKNHSLKGMIFLNSTTATKKKSLFHQLQVKLNNKELSNESKMGE